MNAQVPLQTLSSKSLPVTTIFTGDSAVYDESILGTVHTIVVAVADLIVQTVFSASPTNTVCESAEPKFLPVIVMSYPPPNPPEIGEIESTINS